jgi:hypothetical protein
LIGRRTFIGLSIASGAFFSFRPRSADAGRGRQHYYAGCFYDTAAHSESHMIKHLVDPERRMQKLGPESFGAEMNLLALEIVEADAGFRDRARLSIREPIGNPLVLGLQRAQHEVTSIKVEGVPDEFLTVISITVSLDVMTDKAAFRESHRFESLYSTMMVVNQLYQGREIPNDVRMYELYRNTFKLAVAKVLDVAEKAFDDRREQAKAIFQVHNMVLPNPLPSEVEQLITGALSANGATGGDERAGEIAKLSREMRHIYSQMILDAMEKRNVHELSLLPPTSPWSEARVLRQLEQRLGINAEILAQPDPSRMNGYEIRAGISKAETVEVKKNQIGGVMQLNVSVGSRIVRSQGDGNLIHVPLAIANPMDKVSTGIGYRNFNEVIGMTRSATRDVMMQSFRDASRKTADGIVDLMLAVAKEIH